MVLGVRAACGMAGAAAVLVAVHSHGRRSGGGAVRADTVSWSPGAAAAAAGAAAAWDSNWDKRDPHSLIKPNKKNKEATEDVTSQLENYKVKATRHIFLIRHSQYNLNAQTDKERSLTSLGREQAELTGQRLASLGLNYNVIVHSSMTRAKETTAIISKHLPDVEIVSCDLLREGAPIEPIPPISHWKPEAMYHEDGARIEAAFRRYIHRADLKQQSDSYEIIVCHANVIRYFVCRALQFPPEGWLRMCLNNGSITWLTVRPNGRVALRSLGDTGFMPPDKLTR
ncbi:serine/threonine-protein phosphatase PGAM5, mitochondrial isoform X2 [Callorhinchus milii]|uniref:serine/threonine-protein phosphatase PGAM5, mitochondrial isoform X2 n=1 Tax=Callorhinchus milii TaxID=7868 RepID=UPI001C3F9482|nr:serine/threonine-protein phosphatase PGAM5, mitochondrial isoform X2 [Callorhinchus milii]